MNYFEVLDLSIEELQDKDGATIEKLVKDAHTRLFARTVGPYTGIPRPDGRTQDQWQVILNDARDTLIDSQKRLKHIATIDPPSINMKWKRLLIVVGVIIIAAIGISKIINNTPPPPSGPFEIIFKAAPQAKVYYIENQREIFIGRTMLVLTLKDIKDLSVQEGTKFILKRNGNTKQYIHPDDGERADGDDMIYYTYKWY